MNTFLFSGFAFAGMGFAAETLAKFLIINIIWVPLHLGWLAAGVSIRRMNLAPATQRRVNYAMAASMLIVVGLSVWQGLGGGGELPASR